MSKLTGNPQGTEFLSAQVAQSVGDYYELLQEHGVAKEEYQDAIALYAQVPRHSPDFNAAQTNQAILEQLVGTVPINPVSPGRLLVNLSRWLDNLAEAAEAGWQALEAILEPQRFELAYGYARGATTRKLSSVNSVERAKILEFELPLDKRLVALIVNLQPEENKPEMDVLVQVFAQDEQPYLPLGLILKVTLNPDTPDAESDETTATGKEEGIQLEFSESPSKLVRIEVIWGDTVKVEEFLV
jgi:tetratricopeptide (TPR) repeat protein